MKNKHFLILLILLSFSAKSQDLELLLLAKDDSNLLMKNYMSPVMEGMLYSLNNGWYSSAETKLKFVFEIDIIANAAIVPKSSRTFQFNASDYKYLTSESGDRIFQTVMGAENNSVVSVRIPEAGDYKVAAFSLPDGIGKDLPLNAVPSPMVQVCVGIPFNSDFSIRYLPKINADDVEGNLIGFGFKHDLMQYLSSYDKLFFNVALFAGYTYMDAAYNLGNASYGFVGSNQEATFKFNAYTLQTIASFDLPFISLYAAIGYDKGTSTLKLNGTYELEYTYEGTNNTIKESVTNPINMDFDVNGARGTLGARLNLGFFKIYGDYTFKEYNTLSAGIGYRF